MSPKRCLLVLVMLAWMGQSMGASVVWPQQMTYDDLQFELSGQGFVRYLFWRVFDAALYLLPGTSKETVLDETTPRCLVIRYARAVNADDIRTAADTVLDRQLDPVIRKRLSPAIARIHGVYRNVGAGDHYRLCYVPSSGILLYLNGELQVAIKEKGFARAYFGIWLGPEAPISRSLRRGLLAKSG